MVCGCGYGGGDGGERSTGDGSVWRGDSIGIGQGRGRGGGTRSGHTAGQKQKKVLKKKTMEISELYAWEQRSRSWSGGQVVRWSGGQEDPVALTSVRSVES